MVKEEIVVRRYAVQDSQVIEADVRKERVDITDNSRTRARTDSTLRDECSR